MNLLNLLAQLTYFFLPAGIANMSPVLFKDRLVFLVQPVDGGKTLWGQPVFGSHKTWHGLFFATLIGGIFYLGQYGIALQVPQVRSWMLFDITQIPLWFGFVFAFSAIIGDLIKSFFKRRFHIASGKSWFPFDQIDFLLGASCAALLYFQFTQMMWFIIVSVGPLLHILVNRIAFFLRLKDTPW